MDALSPSKTAGWKKGAKVNCTILVVVSLIMIGLSSIALTNGFQTALFFYSGNCSGGNITTINLGLHLLINVVSTLVVSSPFCSEILGVTAQGLGQCIPLMLTLRAIVGHFISPLASLVRLSV